MAAPHDGIGGRSRRKQDREGLGGTPLVPSIRPRSGSFSVMPNIHQQKKRVRTAERQRAENVRYRSTVRTLTRKLRDAVDEGDKDAVEAAHRDLVRWLDRAVTRGALHRNTAARRKAQAAKLVAPSLAADLDERALELELVRQRAAALQRDVELGQADERSRELCVAPALGRRVGLLHRKLAAPLEPLRGLGRTDAFRREPAARARRARRDRRASTRCRSACRPAGAAAARP